MGFCFYLYVHADGSNYGVTALDMKDASGANMGQLRFPADGDPYIEWSREDGSGVEQLDIPFQRDQWYHVELLYDNDMGYVTITVDGGDPVVVQTNDIASHTIDHIRLIAVKQYTEHNYSYFDEFCFWYQGPGTPSECGSWGKIKALFQ